MVDDALTKALVEAGVAKEYIAAAKALLKERGNIKMVEDDGEFSVIVETDLGNATIDNFVPEWVSGDEGKSFVARPKGTGAGGGEGSKHGDNPWDSSNGKKPNLTKQQEIIKTDPEKARTMARAAGVTPNW